MATYKVTYFPIQGAGEIIRLTLSAAGIPFEDERIAREDWPKLKPNTPMKQMPLLTITKNGKSTMYCQSGAIAKYIARNNGLFGSSPEEELLVDEVCDSLTDTKMAARKAWMETTEEAKKEALRAFNEEAVPRFVGYIKARQAEFGKNGFIIGSKLTLADIAVMTFVELTQLRKLGTDWNKYPEIVKLADLVRSQNGIKEWIAKRPKTDM